MKYHRDTWAILLIESTKGLQLISGENTQYVNSVLAPMLYEWFIVCEGDGEERHHVSPKKDTECAHQQRGLRVVRQGRQRFSAFSGVGAPSAVSNSEPQDVALARRGSVGFAARMVRCAETRFSVVKMGTISHTTA